MTFTAKMLIRTARIKHVGPLGMRSLSVSSAARNYARDKETHFGYETVSESEKAEKGKLVFF